MKKTKNMLNKKTKYSRPCIVYRCCCKCERLTSTPTDAQTATHAPFKLRFYASHPVEVTPVPFDGFKHGQVGWGRWVG